MDWLLKHLRIMALQNRKGLMLAAYPPNGTGITSMLGATAVQKCQYQPTRIRVDPIFITINVGATIVAMFMMVAQRTTEDR